MKSRGCRDDTTWSGNEPLCLIGKCGINHLLRQLNSMRNTPLQWLHYSLSPPRDQHCPVFTV